MRLSTRLLSNAFTTYLRLGATFALGLFATWYILGAVGIVGLGLIALAFSSTGLSHALERALRFGLVRELAAAIASGEPRALRCSLTSAFRLCLQAALPLVGFIAVLAALALAGIFNTPEDTPAFRTALALLILAEGAYAAVRLLAAPYLQTIFAGQQVALDNMLVVVSRATYALSAVIVFGWLLPDAPTAVQLIGFAVSRATLQLIDVPLGIWLAKRRFPGLRLDRSAYDESEYRAVRDTVWNSSQVVMLLNANYLFLAVLINLFFGLSYNGIWQIVVQFSAYVLMFSEGLLRGIAPLATHLQESGQAQAVAALMKRSVRYQLAAVLPAAILLGVYVRPLLELWVGGRLARDPHLASAGISVSSALDLTATLALVLLVAQALRGSFFGVERVLYGMGKVRSYAWFAKWATLICVGSAAGLMAWLRQPIAAAISMLVVLALYSPGVVFSAARRETGLSLSETLRGSLPRPVVANLALLALLWAARGHLEELTPFSLAVLLVGAGTVYGALAVWIIAEADERRRLFELARRGLEELRRRLTPGRGAPSDP